MLVSNISSYKWHKQAPAIDCWWSPAECYCDRLAQQIWLQMSGWCIVMKFLRHYRSNFISCSLCTSTDPCWCNTSLLIKQYLRMCGLVAHQNTVQWNIMQSTALAQMYTKLYNESICIAFLRSVWITWKQVCHWMQRMMPYIQWARMNGGFFPWWWLKTVRRVNGNVYY